ncbi:hypothetical protein CAPTEDRAFT_201014 [Capitella teleta]|uniref:Uncharacterized protein n=1 Tax=Capitella teleta TaxID=283909 RepID=R7UAZ3_CAPTE|nr:hypothetical protein CAPTEDRAFT_201014 [Capitella teleta]|eukprot:ELU03525.1 hypothetical protein CAPTEDRAFT_201014 [Capitella teleta]
MELKITILPLLLVFFVHHAVQASSCQFPSYLTQRTRWESKISLNRRSTGVYWKFHDRVLEIVDLTTLDADSVLHQCHSELPGQKYVVYRESDGVTSYQCLKFITRSNQVVQFKASVSVKEEEFEADVLCADDSLELDPWPLIWPGETDTYHACPLTGGYDFYMHDNKNKETTCENSHLKPRMESECMTGEGLTLDFRSFECRGRIEMELKQTLYCLGTWNEEDYTYSVVTDNDDLWPKLWVLRFSLHRDQKFSARLYNDIAVDIDSAFTENYFELHFEQAYYPSLCENEASPCLDCDINNAFYCQKTCHTCDALRDVDSCEFDVPSQGEWQEISHQGNRDIAVTSSMIYADDMLPLQCFDLHTDVWYEDKNYRAVATVFKNGCKPRYTCVEFVRISTSVLMYRISQNLIWPQKLILSGQDVCAEEQFRDDPKPLSGEFRSKGLRPLLKKKGVGQHHPTVSCGISGKFLLDAKMMHRSMNCTAYLEACSSSHTFSLQTDSACSGSVDIETHRCLGSFESGSTTMIITDKPAGNGDYYCWAFYKEEWDSVYSVYLLYASDCHAEIGRNIRYYNFKGHLAEFGVKMGSGLFGSHSCHDEFPDMLPTTVDITAKSSAPGIITQSSSDSIDFSTTKNRYYTTSTAFRRSTPKPVFPSTLRKLPTTPRLPLTTPQVTQFSTRMATHAPTAPPQGKSAEFSPELKKPGGGNLKELNQYKPVAAAIKSNGAADACTCSAVLLTLSFVFPLFLSQ